MPGTVAWEVGVELLVGVEVQATRSRALAVRVAMRIIASAATEEPGSNQEEEETIDPAPPKLMQGKTDGVDARP